MKLWQAGSIVVAISLCGCSMPPPAQEADGYTSDFDEGGGGSDASNGFGRQGGYAAVGGLYAWEDFDDSVSGVSISVDDSVGLNARGGYRAGPHFAGEILFDWLDEFEAEVMGVDLASLDGWALTANAKLYLTDGWLQPYGVIGGGIMEGEVEDSLGLGFESDETDFVARGGAGVDVYLSDAVFLFVEGAYYHPFDDLEDFNFYTASGGVGIRF